MRILALLLACVAGMASQASAAASDKYLEESSESYRKAKKIKELGESGGNVGEVWENSDKPGSGMDQGSGKSGAARTNKQAPGMIGGGPGKSAYQGSFDDGSDLLIEAPKDPGKEPAPPAELAGRAAGYLEKTDQQLEKIMATSKQEIVDIYSYCDNELPKILEVNCADKSWPAADRAKCKKEKAKAQKFCDSRKKYIKDREKWIALSAFALKHHGWEKEHQAWKKYQDRKNKKRKK